MIDSVSGILKEKEPTRIVIEAVGIGYEIFIPFSTYEKLPGVGSTAKVLTHLVHRELAMELFGFSVKKERDLFRLLLGISGIGPRVALAVLSGMAVDEFLKAVAAGESRYLTKINGVGKKKADRIVLELRDKISDIQVDKTEEVSGSEEARKVLLALGYKEADIDKALKKISTLRPGLDTETIVKLALKEL